MRTFWNQTWSLAKANLKIRYRQTWSGVLWVILNPAIMLAIQSFVFSQVFKTPQMDYLLYISSGLLPWFFLSQTLDMGTSLFRTQATAIKSYSLEPFIFIAALVLENFVNFLMTCLFIFLPILIYQDESLLALAKWSLAIIPLVLSTASLAFVISCLNVVFRDTRYIVSFVLSIAYFLTPIFYKIEILPEQLRGWMRFNFFHLLLLPFQNTQTPWLIGWFIAICVSAILIIFSIVFWRRIRNTFYLNL